MVMYEKGRYRIVSMDYNCHPETCCHWEHYPYCIQRSFTSPFRWEWYAYEDSFDHAKKVVDALAEAGV